MYKPVTSLAESQGSSQFGRQSTDFLLQTLCLIVFLSYFAFASEELTGNIIAVSSWHCNVFCKNYYTIHNIENLFQQTFHSGGVYFKVCDLLP